MKKIVSIVLAVILLTSGLFIFTGCNKTNQLDKPYSELTVDDLLSLFKNTESVTAEEYLSLLDTLRNVKIKDDLTLEDSITKKAIDAIKSKPRQELYLEQLLSSDSEQVRGYGISLISSITGVTSKNLELAKKLIANETSEYVLYQATKALSNEVKKDPAIKEFIFKMAKHENPKIRQAAANAIGNSWSEGVEGAVDEIITLMNDSDKEVKKAACRYSGRLHDEKVIETLVTILNDPEQSDFHGDAVEGLCHLWYDYPFFEQTSEKAYNATMNYFKKTPRNDKVPAWTAFSAFKTKSSEEEKFNKWKEKATYFNTDDLYNIMVDIIKDENANYLSRTSAIDIVKAHCSEEQFNSLEDIVNSLTDKKAAIVKSSYESKKKTN